MNTTEHEQNDTLKSAWLGWAWILPQLLLGLLNWHAWVLIRGDVAPQQAIRAIQIGLFEASLLAFGGLAWNFLAARRKPIGVALALAAIAAHIGYLWLFLVSIDRLLPATVSLWMLPQSELIFYQFSLMMPVVFLMMIRLARIRLGLSTGVDVGLSLAALVVIPAGTLIVGSLLVNLGHRIAWHDRYQYLLIAAMVAGTAFILTAFLRLMIRLHDLIQRKRWSEWAIPLTAGLVAPLSGLALNASIPFPYDFQSVAVYVMTLLNAAALLIPFRPATRLALPGWAARAMFYPFTLYFFLVFLPFLPLSLLAMIAAGAGFLILAPLLLFTVHTRRLWEQGRVLATQYGTTRMVAGFAACVLVLPVAILLRNEMDRRTLNHAVDAVFNPDHSATRVPVHPVALGRALDRMDDMKHGLYQPYLSDLYNVMVFHGMVLPDEKADLIRKCLLGNSRVADTRSGLWQGGFFGTRSRTMRQFRGGSVSRQVIVASHEVERRETNGVAETDITFVLENKGGANGEFSERITVPEGVLVTGFWLDVNGTRKPAQLRERKAATWVYEMIRDMTRRDPGLVVYEDDRHLRLRVYPFTQGETRRCGLRFRFPAALKPDIQLTDIRIPLADTPEGMAVSATLTDGEAVLVAPASTTTDWPSFRRDVVAHLILDQSACAATNHAAVVTRARVALAALPPSITRVNLTWANYEQEDLTGTPLSREEASLALDRIPTLPGRGGFCPERVIARVLLAADSSPRTPEPAGYAPLFVVIPAPGSSPVRTGSLAPFTRLAPDLPAYALLDSNGWHRIAWDSTTETPVHPADLTPSKCVAVRNGARTTLLTDKQGGISREPGATSQGWQVWNPATSQFEKITNTTSCEDPAILAGYALWSQHHALALTPDKVDAALPRLIQETRAAGVLIPEAAMIVLETQAQEVMLARKERQSLSANHALEFDEAKTTRAPAPSVLWLIPPAVWLLWRRKKG